MQSACLVVTISTDNTDAITSLLAATIGNTRGHVSILAWLQTVTLSQALHIL